MKYRGFTQKNNNNKVVDFYKDSTWEHLQFCLSYQFAQMGPWVLGWMVHAYKLLTKTPSFEDPDHLNFSPFFPCIVECGLSLYFSLQAFIGHQMFFFFFFHLEDFGGVCPVNGLNSWSVPPLYKLIPSILFMLFLFPGNKISNLL